jgi:cytochrome c peroxidase
MTNDGRQLFVQAGCGGCHVVSQTGIPTTDGQYHHSGIGDATQSSQLPQLVQDVLSENLDASALGPRVLTNAQWSDLGRFVVSHRPADIGAFRTPSLRNVAVTAPYMHDGSIVTLEAAVDHEIYYRGFSSGHPINLTQAERNAIVAFLESLTDAHIDAAKTQSRGSSKP